MNKLLIPLLLAFSFSANATVISTFYGDDDGFGVGAIDTIDPNVSNNDVSDAPLTDSRLIGTGFLAGPFNPIGGFDPFVLDGDIISASLTLRAGSFDSDNSVDGQNQIFLDGLLVDTAFIDGFSTANSNLVETRTIDLDMAFFALLADGNVSLLGTVISEASGSGSFQVDFLRLDITTAPAVVPVPAAAWLFGSALLGLFGFSRRKKLV